MKIDDRFHPLRPARTGKSGPNSPAGSSFQALLDVQLRPASPGAPPAGVAGPAPVAGVAQLAATSRVQGLSLGTAAVDTLEAYGRALANPALGIASLEPLVERLEEQVAAVAEVGRALPAEDALRPLLDRVGAAAVVAAAKYRRGDFGD
ncbi:MAG: hypothetical protein AB1634_10515 [Thermodesulfobacteriota bacterium]